MISAEAYIEARECGMSHEEAIACLPPYIPSYVARMPAPIHRAVLCSCLKVFPIFNYKQALHPHELRGLASSDIATVMSWARSNPIWAVATGQDAGLHVVEANDVAGLDSLLALCGDDWDWLETLRVMDGSRRQIFFEWPQGYDQLPDLGSLLPGLRLYGPYDCLLLPGWESNKPRQSHYFLNPTGMVQPTPQWLLDFAFKPKCTPPGLLVPLTASDVLRQVERE